MGLCSSKAARPAMSSIVPIDLEAKAKSASLDRQLRADEPVFRRKCKILLLGAGESGKSTLLKQMRIIYLGGISHHERTEYRGIVRENLVLSMLALLTAMDDLGVPFGSTQSFEHASEVRRLADLRHDLDATAADAIRGLWADFGVRSLLNRANEFQVRRVSVIMGRVRRADDAQLNDSAAYFFNCVDRIAQSDYTPTDADCLRARVRTTGVTETEFTDRGTDFVFVDVRGALRIYPAGDAPNASHRLVDSAASARNGAPLWALRTAYSLMSSHRISQFENVSGLAFLVAVSEYDLMLREDGSQNRMVESMAVFDSIISSRFFERTSIVLLLNKVDILKAKLPKAPAYHLWPNIAVDASWKEVAAHFSSVFVKLNKQPGRTIHVHYTCSTDTELMRKLSTTLMDQLARRNLERVVRLGRSSL